ncbi:DNA-methyltransferase [Desulfonema magnum]|uniref:Methyltransferase n=1 Tax=Desulfonema magnum TaxID=45655 RepID=A0A975BG94_9BACT|nr:site-specific DNA-methyltransferase [Desulfonema magnum]QTA84816.1 SAM-dependent DNA methylase [Desulfonema magnum]
METTHHIIFENSNNMVGIPSDSVDLVVTSPPYPMIEMWDEMFSGQNRKIHEALNNQDGSQAFELMHKELDAVWNDVRRILKKGGFVCINIGDATRTLNGNFALYPNHSRIVSQMLRTGFTALPEILWRKQTNAPNKFMGSGMLPAGAYVTLEHEFILIFRKGEKREFKKNTEKTERRKSSYFWEERNVWFSDIWTDLKGTSQHLSDTKIRKRSAAFPFEVPYRLINMFSVKGDTVLDPFLGIGTTTYAAMAACRNSVGYELESGFRDLIFSGADKIVPYSNKRISKRITSHLDFVKQRFKAKGRFRHINNNYNFPVITQQEKELIFNELISVTIKDKDVIEITYSDSPQDKFCIDEKDCFNMQIINQISPKRKH